MDNHFRAAAQPTISERLFMAEELALRETYPVRAVPSAEVVYLAMRWKVRDHARRNGHVILKNFPARQAPVTERWVRKVEWRRLGYGALSVSYPVVVEQLFLDFAVVFLAFRDVPEEWRDKLADVSDTTVKVPVFRGASFT